MAATTSTTQSTTLTNSKLELELRELKRELQTMNKQYLDATVSRPAGSRFHAIGLSTFEDWTVAAFFFTFALFGLVLTGYVASLSITPWRVTIFGLILTVILLGIAGILLQSLG